MEDLLELFSVSFVCLSSLYQILGWTVNTACLLDTGGKDLFNMLPRGTSGFHVVPQRVDAWWTQEFCSRSPVKNPTTLIITISPRVFQGRQRAHKPVLPLLPNYHREHFSNREAPGCQELLLQLPIPPTVPSWLPSSDWSEPMAGSVLRPLPEPLVVDRFFTKLECDTRIRI